jgi:hypothetical protein
MVTMAQAGDAGCAMQFPNWGESLSLAADRCRSKAPTDIQEGCQAELNCTCGDGENFIFSGTTLRSIPLYRR